MKKITALSALILLAWGADLWARKFWEEKAFTEWTEEEATELLSDSPWVKEESVALMAGTVDLGDAAPRPSAGGPPDAGPGGLVRQGGINPAMRIHPVFITWMAEPVRKAHARLAQLRGHLQSEEALARSIAGNPDVLQFILQGRALAHILEGGERAIQENSYLRKKSGQKIPMARAALGENFKRNPMIVLLFPAQDGEKPLLTLEDREVELIIQIGNYKLTPKFKLKDMVMGGELML